MKRWLISGLGAAPAHVSMVGLKRMEQYVEKQKGKKNLEEILLRQYFSTRSWEDGKWMFIAPEPSSNQQYFMCEVIFPRFSAINHQHSGYLALV